jgi:Skp family chaperone for outer membrane proteins
MENFSRELPQWEDSYQKRVRVIQELDDIRKRLKQLIPALNHDIDSLRANNRILEKGLLDEQSSTKIDEVRKQVQDISDQIKALRKLYETSSEENQEKILDQIDDLVFQRSKLDMELADLYTRENLEIEDLGRANEEAPAIRGDVDGTVSIANFLLERQAQLLRELKELDNQ